MGSPHTHTHQFHAVATKCAHITFTHLIEEPHTEKSRKEEGKGRGEKEILRETREKERHRGRTYYLLGIDFKLEVNLFVIFTVNTFVRAVKKIHYATTYYPHTR